MIKRRIVIDVDWLDRKLAKQTKTEAGGRKRFGEPRWGVLKRRLALLVQADTLADVENAGGFHALTADRAGSFAMKLDGPCRLVFRPFEQPPPLTEHGGIDLTRVQSVVIEEVVNYHG